MTTSSVIASKEIFVIPRDDGKFYLYAPLRRNLAVVNGPAAAAVATYLEDGEAALRPCELTVVNSLKEEGFMGEPSPGPPIFPAGYEFCPHEVTLFPTSQCNLRCRYCYADAGKKCIVMSWEIARAAIDLVAANAGLLGSKNFAVGFHGGGEPTAAWPLIVKCVDYAHKKADDMGLDVEVFAASNGLLSMKKREYIIENFTTLNVSMDGPKDIQDYNRPKVNGGGSYDEIRESLKFFDDAGFHYGLRSTITIGTVHRMEEIVEHLALEFNIDYLHMEPVWSCGRCISTGESPPSDEDFIYHFRKAIEKGRQNNVNVFYSGARLDVLTSKFCAAAGDGFNILPEGIVTSCYEVTESTDSRSDIFHFGSYDAETKTFVFDRNRIESLMKLSVEHIPFCRDCFCRWHCAGDCLAKVFERSGSATHNGSIRCKLNRELILADLDDLVKVAKSGDDSVCKTGE